MQEKQVKDVFQIVQLIPNGNVHQLKDLFLYVLPFVVMGLCWERNNVMMGMMLMGMDAHNAKFKDFIDVQVNPRNVSINVAILFSILM